MLQSRQSRHALANRQCSSHFKPYYRGNFVCARCTATADRPQQATSLETSKHSNIASAIGSSTLAASLLLGCWLAPGAAYALPESQLSELQAAIEKDFSEGQYYVTGKLTPSLYDPNCTFKDPTTNVKGVGPYTTAVAALFDPAVSHADLISSTVSGPNSITLKWRLEGRLAIGNLNIKPYTGTTVYTVDEGSGLITRHDETWDISALDAFVSTLIPGFGAPPAPPL